MNFPDMLLFITWLITVMWSFIVFLVVMPPDMPPRRTTIGSVIAWVVHLSVALGGATIAVICIVTGRLPEGETTLMAGSLVFFLLGAVGSTGGLINAVHFRSYEDPQERQQKAAAEIRRIRSKILARQQQGR